MAPEPIEKTYDVEHNMKMMSKPQVFFYHHRYGESARVHVERGWKTITNMYTGAKYAINMTKKKLASAIYSDIQSMYSPNSDLDHDRATSDLTESSYPAY
jgi:hypothetical protein